MWHDTMKVMTGNLTHLGLGTLKENSGIYIPASWFVAQPKKRKHMNSWQTVVNYELYLSFYKTNC